MEHEDFYLLMMEALDGELLADEQRLLEAHLSVCSSCRREWQAVTAVDALFRRSPILSPAAGFTQRTLARLPNQRVRLWAMGAVYITLLMSGLLPLLLVLAAAFVLVPLLREPVIVDSALQLLLKGWLLIAALGGALLNGASQLLVEQPGVWGWLLVMAGIVLLWSGVYRQLVNSPARQTQQILKGGSL
jgi:anti-sigma factor RsiW